MNLENIRLISTWVLIIILIILTIMAMDARAKVIELQKDCIGFKQDLDNYSWDEFGKTNLENNSVIDTLKPNS